MLSHMALYEITGNRLLPVPETRFGDENVHERRDLQRLLAGQVDIIAPDSIVLSEEFGEWEESRRRIDLLALDKDANLVVIELKRTESGGHMELQALRYAAMVSTMTFAQAVDAHARYLSLRSGDPATAEAAILTFLGWVDADEEEFGKDVRIILASADFSREVTSTVLWLNDHGLDIECVRLRPYRFDARVLLDVQRVIPLPEAAEYQRMVRNKEEQKRIKRASDRDYTRYRLMVDGHDHGVLPKRRLIYLAVRAVIESARATPEDISKAIRARTGLWLSVEGLCDGSQFMDKARALREEKGRGADLRRYFADEGELVHCNGRTYAFTNQWGGLTIQALQELAQAYPALEITWEAAER